MNQRIQRHTVRRIVTPFAALRSKDLGKWIADAVAFLSAMVDRIVPGTTDSNRDAVSSALTMREAVATAPGRLYKDGARRAMEAHVTA